MANTSKKGLLYFLEKIADGIEALSPSPSPSGYGLQVVKLSDTASHSIPAAGGGSAAVEFALSAADQAEKKIVGLTGLFELHDSSNNRVHACITQAFTMNSGKKVKVSFDGAANEAKTASSIDIYVFCAPIE